MKKFSAILTVSGAFLFGIIGASVALADNLSRHEAVELVLKENPELKAARFIISQAKGRLIQAGLYSNPEIEASRSSDYAFNREGEYGYSTGFKQKFPISGRLSRAKDVAKVDVILAEAEVQNQTRLLIGETLGLYREASIASEKARYNLESQKILKELIQASERRYKLAEVSKADVNLEKIELEKLLIEHATLQIEERQKKIELNRLLGREPERTPQLSDSLEKSVSNETIRLNVDNAVERRPDRLLAALQISRAQAEVKLARAERWEDWSLGVDYSRDKGKFNDPIGTKSDDFLGLSVSIPLPLWNQNQGRIAEIQATESKARGELVALELRIRSEAQAASTKLLSLVPVLKQYEEQSLKLAEDNVLTLQKSYTEGLTGISAVVQAQQQLISLRQSYLETLSQFSKALTDFEVATASNDFLSGE